MRRLAALVAVLGLTATGCLDTQDPAGPAAPIPSTVEFPTPAGGADDAVTTTIDPGAPEPWWEHRGALEATVVETFPHDPDAFNQGLELVDPDTLLESTGRIGDRRLVDLVTGEVQVEVDVDPEFFPEGATVVGDELIQLTWQAGVAFRADLDTLAETQRFTYQGEGWGLCLADDGLLWMSDGSSTLTRRDPFTFESVGTVGVTLNGEPVERLNELECVGDRVLANVWMENWLAVIDPASGEVTATVDLSALVPPGLGDGDAVLNGIAHDPADDTLLVTGKLWPTLSRIELAPAG